MPGGYPNKRVFVASKSAIPSVSQVHDPRKRAISVVKWGAVTC